MHCVKYHIKEGDLRMPLHILISANTWHEIVIHCKRNSVEKTQGYLRKKYKYASGKHSHRIIDRNVSKKSFKS